MPPQLSWRKKLAYSLLVLAVFCGAGELAVRIFAPAYAHTRIGPEVTGGYAVGPRGADRCEPLAAAPKRPNEVRLIFIGDSVTWGTGLAFEHTVPEQTEAKLKAARPDVDWNCINMAGQGISPSLRRDYFRENVPKWPADAIIYQFQVNDVASADEQVRQRGPSIKPGLRGLFANGGRVLRVQYLRHSACVAWVEEKSKAIYRLMRGPVDPEQYGLAGCCDSPEIRARWDEQFAAMADLRSLCDERGIGFRLYMFPNAENLSDDPRDNTEYFDRSKFTVDAYQRFDEYREKYSLAGRHLLNEVKAEREAMLAGEIPYDRLYFILDTCHPNRRGAEIFAEAVAADILAGKVLKLPSLSGPRE